MLGYIWLKWILFYSEPERHILFGEWLYAKHSIHYTQLPSYFIAFDLFDKKENKFYSRRERNKVLDQTTIPYVPLIQEQPLASARDVSVSVLIICYCYVTHTMLDSEPIERSAVPVLPGGYRGCVLKDRRGFSFLEPGQTSQTERQRN